MDGGEFNIFWFLSLLAPAIIMLAASISRRVWVSLLAALVSLGATYWFCVLAVAKKWDIRGQLATTEAQRQWVYDNDGANQAFTAIISGPFEAILYTIVWGVLGWKLVKMYRARASHS